MRNLAFAAAAFAAVLAAAAAPARAQHVVFPVTVTQDSATVKFASDATGVRVPRDVDIVVELTCEGSANCGQADAVLLDVDERGRDAAINGEGTRQVRRFTIRADEVPPGSAMRVVLELAGTTHQLRIPTIPLETTPHAFLNRTCDERLTVQGDFYDEQNNQAQFVVSPTGTVLARPNEPIDENDAVFVYIVGSPDDVRNLRITRSSLAREGGVISIQGLEVVDDSKRERDLYARVARRVIELSGQQCAVVRADLGDFDSGRGKIQITRMGTGQNESDKDMGAFDLTVNPLYRGAFMFGPVVTQNAGRTFDTLADRTIYEKAVGVQTHYVVGYAHFLTGSRDTDKGGGLGASAVVAVKPDELLDHVFVGGSVDLFGALFLMGGAHLGESTRINEASGLRVGEKLPAGFTSVPTQDEWRLGWFGGVGVDVRAAARLVGDAASALVKGQ